MKISVVADGFDKLGFDIFYLLEVVHPEKNIVAGKAKTGMLCFDYTTKKKAPIPEKALAKFTTK